ncbi:hypothetical protein Xcc3_25960 [Xanthomonas campestris pv. campestris]|uniref:hypothetical protein n=3 Tax=Xanthomonas campestris TaxID=339 RepID=UPI000C28F402|nr:hypothetical protein [Xanthomonas campestris]MDM7613179.1 hypothetical protein [Xanthomonas campestris pv. campestris]MDM7635368.1 hypothetical protein [Xanthomonas campestris pv. campestris]MDM7787004.1 hypothetical protein [Xanthomonas campestris pv. campestris]MEB1263517.1 hypothetical protein [Xanthomonas campestris pv. campestris]MEB1317036.1 hypothetical protein [Xanthomonas campestris pv. campestris]
MTDSTFSPIPSTFQMLQKIKRPKMVSKLERIENYIFWGLLALTLFGLGVIAADNFEWISRPTAKDILLMVLLVMAIGFLALGLLQIAQVISAWKEGYEPMADRIDMAISAESEILDELGTCNPQTLRERSKHIDLENKLLTRRAGLSTFFGAIGVVLVNLFDAGEKVNMWANPAIAKVFVYAGSLGILIGSIVVFILAGKLERIAGLFGLAADRIEQRPAPEKEIV